MGMSASQARLLTLTARMHDIEFKAQSIESQKIALATQQDELYENYCAALDATKIQVAYRGDGVGYKYVDATFGTVCTYQPNRCKQQYAMRNNNTGLIMVTADVKNAYDLFPNDKYAFAFAAMGITYNEACEIGIGNAQGAMDEEEGYEHSDKGDCYMTELEEQIYLQHADSDATLKKMYEAIDEASGTSEKRQALEAFRDKLYKVCGTEIYDALLEEDANSDIEAKEYTEMKQEFNYYASLYEAIHEAGGCEEVPVEYMNGEDGQRWFDDQLDTANATLLEFNDSGVNKGWTDTSVATSINPNYLIETDDDEKAKKAEAEYEHELKVIDRKDKKFDNELSKLETERTAIKTEMDSIKQVKDDNIDRTFGIFG